jgi:hypothetical protein
MRESYVLYSKKTTCSLTVISMGFLATIFLFFTFSFAPSKIKPLNNEYKNNPGQVVEHCPPVLGPTF